MPKFHSCPVTCNIWLFLFELEFGGEGYEGLGEGWRPVAVGCRWIRHRERTDSIARSDSQGDLEYLRSMHDPG